MTFFGALALHVLRACTLTILIVSLEVLQSFHRWQKRGGVLKLIERCLLIQSEADCDTMLGLSLVYLGAIELLPTTLS